MLLFNFNRIYFLIIILLSLLASPAQSKVYYSKQEAMVLAFGEQADVEMLSLFPDQQQKQQIEQLARAKLGSSLYTFYVGKKQGKVIGYAALETQTVRTKPETLLIVLDPNGNLKNIHTLAFHEPPEYQPPKKWYDLLKLRSIEELQLNRSIQGISGATLSTRAALHSSRKVLSIFQNMVKQQVTLH